jgi:ribosomal protein S18 acetylase RimI-like enzyme
MFASIELARRIEGAETRMMASIAGIARTRTPDGAVVIRPIGGGVAVFVRPDSPMNKAIGLGFDGAIDDAELADVEAAWQERRAPLQVELAALARCEAAQQLAARGYELRAFENVLGCALPVRGGAAPPGLVVERTSDAETDAWIEAVVDSFVHGDGTGAGSPDAFARGEMTASMREMMAVPDMHRYVVHHDGAIAGGASMRLDPEGVAQLCGAGTLPAFRRRGVQSALLHARLAVAAAAGCDVAVITTQPGSKSQANAQRHGFALLYTRAILVKAPAA